MLKTSYVHGISPTYAFIVSQIFAASEPTKEQPPELSWRFGEMRPWSPDLAFVYATNNTAPATWTSISKLRTRPTTPQG